MESVPSVGKYVWVIDQVGCQDGWTLAKFFFCLFMDRDGVKVHKVAKRNKANIMIHAVILTEQA